VIDMHKDDRAGGGALVLHAGSGLALAGLADDARAYVAASLAPATRRAYATDWRLFGEWCAERGLEPLRAAPATLITDSLVRRPPSFKPAGDATRLYAPACA
jgi:hypothetical protein